MNVISISLAAFLVSFVPCMADAPPTASALPDTGMTKSYTKSFGEDSDYHGSDPSWSAPHDGTITDLITGLTWQTSDGGEMTWEMAVDYAKSLKLANHDDWRLPTSMELLSIMDHSRHAPAMNTTIFPPSTARYWWTLSPRADDPTRIWVVNAGGGIGAHLKSMTPSAGGDRPVHVRCVRGPKRLLTGPSLSKSAPASVTDSQTGLTWQTNPPTTPMTWEQAISYCESLNHEGHDDWRLPNIKELRSLSDDGKIHPSFDTTLLTQASTFLYWSSSTQCNTPSRAWMVDFDTGLVTYHDKSDTLLVRAVRGGSAIPGPTNKPSPNPADLIDPHPKPQPKPKLHQPDTTPKPVDSPVQAPVSH